MKKIHLSGVKGKGLFALVDDEDFEHLNQFKWHKSAFGYAIRKTQVEGKQKVVWMHRVVNNTKEGLITDHIDRDKLNNQKKNLRAVDHSTNAYNSKLFNTNKSGYRGVCWAKNMNKWRASITKNYEHIIIGYYDNISDAVMARKLAERS
jgi:hypothetical protein